MDLRREEELLDGPGELREGAAGRQQPAVADAALVDVLRPHAVPEELRVLDHVAGAEPADVLGVVP